MNSSDNKQRRKKMITLWSLRTTFARGTHFVAERDCLETTANEWFKVFQAEEPTVTFVLSVKKPKLSKVK